MAERSARKPKRRGEQAHARASRMALEGIASGEDLAERLAVAERELAEARARIRELEERQAQVLNRIDWMIDSLHSSLGE